MLLPINYFLMGYGLNYRNNPFLPPLVASPSPGSPKTSFWCSHPNFNPTVMFCWWSLEPASDIILRQWEVSFRECEQLHSLGPFWQWALSKQPSWHVFIITGTYLCGTWVAFHLKWPLGSCSFIEPAPAFVVVVLIWHLRRHNGLMKKAPNSYQEV